MSKSLNFNQLKEFVLAQKDSRKLNYIHTGKRRTLGFHIGAEMTNRRVSRTGFFTIFIAAQGNCWGSRFRPAFNIIITDIRAALFMYYSKEYTNYRELKEALKQFD